MQFHPFEVSIPHIIYAALGGFVVFFGMFSLFVREKLYIGEACWAFLFGVVIGPYGANIFDPRDWGHGERETTNMITLEFTRVVLAIGVFAIGVELPKAYMARHWKSLFFLLGPIMTWGWFVSGALIYALIPGLNFLSSLAIAACLTPTDPILAAAVVGGKYADKHVPAHLRHLLAAESGCNDGAAYPFLWIALYLTIDKSTGKAISDWFLFLWLYQVILGIVFGAVLGLGFRYLMKFCERRDLIDRQSYVAQYVSLALLTIGSCSLLGTDDLLAAFSCGTAFAWDGFFNKQTEEAVFSSVIDLLFNIAAFVFVGAWMPFDSFSDATISLSVWRLIVIAILVLILRRLPIMIALYRWIPDVKTFREAIFSGHFGPMGIGAIFISTLAAEQLPEPEHPPANQQELLAATIQPVVAFMVLCSITIHGLSIPFFSLGRRVHSVSRTWSRHDTYGRTHSLPEWANQIRRVHPGQPIEINRDADLERGDITIHDPDAHTEKRIGSDSSDTQTQQDEQAMREDGTDMRAQSPPDGTEILAEWKEGPHKVVEKRRGPGDEVEVEVERNAYGTEPSTVSSLRVAEDAAAEAVNEIRNKLSHTLPDSPPRGTGAFDKVLHDVESGLKHEAREAGQAVRNLEESAKRSANEHTEANSSSPQTPRLNGEEDEEGWMSDGEGDKNSIDGRRRSKSPKLKPKTVISRPLGASRRRASIRRGLLGGARPGTPMRSEETPQPSATPAPIIQESSSSTGESDNDRGRRLGTKGPKRPVSAHHARIDSLRSLDSNRSLRDSSPSRSVRWADEDNSRSGSHTPRITSPSAVHTPLPGSEVPSENEDEGQNEPTWSPTQVRFSVPNPTSSRRL